jgi:uncharacterized protein (DUF2126 family)
MLFSPLGHTPGPLDTSRLQVDRSQDYPFTLDLRRYSSG